MAARGRPPEPTKAWERFLAWTGRAKGGGWIFRGHADRRWELKPGFGRLDSYSPERERLSLLAFKQQAALFVDGRDLKDWEWLVLAQHHGLPTRLLDWTSNPLVACFFAVRDAMATSCDAEVVAIKVDSLDWLSERDLAESPYRLLEVRLLRPVQRFGRVHAQHGIFSVHPRPDIAWSGPTPARGPGARQSRFLVSTLWKRDFLQRLALFGIDEARLMGDLDGVASVLAWRLREKLSLE